MTEQPWFIEFYAPWCPHCQRLAPVWDDLHRRNQEIANIARVDCTSENGRPLCKNFDVHAYPTLLFFPLGHEKHFLFQGSRTLEALEDWLKKEVTREAEELEDPESVDEEALELVKDVRVVDRDEDKDWMEDSMPFVNAMLVSLKSTFLQ